jgi:hypothetical protein
MTTINYTGYWELSEIISTLALEAVAGSDR